MEPLMVIASVLTYLIFYNGCLTFRLSIAQNIMAAAMIAFNILFFFRIMGMLIAVPLLVTMILYAGWLKKEDFWLNAILILLSYIITVVVDNPMHLVLKVCGIEAADFWLANIFIEFPVIYAASRFISKKAVAVRDSMRWTPAPKVSVLISADIMLCALIFIRNIRAVDQAGSTAPDLFWGVILYTAYFLLTYLMIAVIVKESGRNAEMMMKQHSYDNLKEYMDQIEELYQSLRTFKHDYANIMMSMAGYLESDDLEGLKQYYEREVYPLGRQLHRENHAAAGLRNLAVIELKSLISVKANYAMEQHIRVDIEIPDKIEQTGMKSIDLVRVVGILLDNAIEACQECSSPVISIGIIKSARYVTFIVKNTYIKKEIDYSRLGSLGISSKGERRGNGLHIAKTIIGRCSNATLDTEYDGACFTQSLEIFDEGWEPAE